MGAFKIVKLVGQGLNNTIISGGLVPKGAYDNSTDYGVGDSVDYQGSSYVMHTNAGAGTLPTDTTKWQVLANKGNTGATGSAGGTGPQGDPGDDGEAATIEVGNVTTGAAGTSATVTNVGTAQEAVFDFVIPRGNTGTTGGTGPQGPQGDPGSDGETSIAQAIAFSIAL